jgi:F-type H+-transporting ATPase subunit epsilon
MAKTFKVSIVTAEQVLLETEAVSLSLPGIAGYLGILANHAPLVTALVPGVMTRAEEALERAKQRLAERSNPEVDADRAEAALAKAKARLMAAGKNR